MTRPTSSDRPGDPQPPASRTPPRGVIAEWLRSGEVDRGRYLLVGTIATMVKFALDRLLLAHRAYNNPLGPWAYWIPGNLFGPFTTPDFERDAPVLAAVACPFIVLGVVLTLARLRSVGWPALLVLVFFAPGFNLVLFAVLSIAPASLREPTPTPVRTWLMRAAPQSGLGSAMASIAVTSAITTLLATASLHGLGRYGSGLFVGLPFALGFLATLFHTIHGPRRFSECATVACLSVVLVGSTLMAFGLEGAVCVIMAAPIGLVLAVLGAAVGWAVSSSRRGRGETGVYLLALIAAQPLLIAADGDLGPEVASEAVVDEVFLPAEPARVWAAIQSVDAIAGEKPWLLRIGAPTPLFCTLEREESGALRTCHFAEGLIEERVVLWDHPKTLRMEVLRSTLPGRHWLRFTEAEYVLHPTAGGTRLVRTTRYESALHPRWYWSWLEREGIGAEHRYLLDSVTP